MRLKSHQALNFKIKWNLISCVLPDFGSLVMYLIRTLIDNSKIYFSSRMIGEKSKKVDLDRKGDKKMIIHQHTLRLREKLCRDVLKPNIATATLPILSRSPLRSPAIISSATIGHYTITATTYRNFL